MERFFNTEGPVDPRKHYCLPALERIDLAEVLSLIDREKYFVLHAPRQSGKTTCLLALRDHLERDGKFLCVYTNLEIAQGLREQVDKGLSLILRDLARSAIHAGDTTAETIRPKMEAEASRIVSLTDFLTQWCAALEKPLVLLLDEIDSLVGDMLVTVLRHLRAGYHNRPTSFPQSLILCGVRDVRDYRLRLDEGKEVITGGSAFNIKAESLRLGDFRREDLEALYRQHTAATGQVFEPAAVELAWELTQGQPWLVNALAYEACFRNVAGRDRARPITQAQVLAAKEALIRGRVTHLHQLADKLREERVRGDLEKTIEQGVAQTLEYQDRTAAAEAHLVLFDRRPSRTWEAKLFRRVEERGGRSVVVWGM